MKLLRRSPQRNGAVAASEAGPRADVPAPSPSPELLAQRERLTERFALMQSELGGLFYEMAIRDHVKMEVLIAKAAELQRVDSELSQVEHLLRGDGGGAIGGHCPQCGTAHARGAAFCSQCATPLGGS
ncbi:MAG: zinc-ribbon domain-containing protein [Solirubrobacteraceae bacterium]